MEMSPFTLAAVATIAGELARDQAAPALPRQKGDGFLARQKVLLGKFETCLPGLFCQAVALSGMNQHRRCAPCNR